MGWLRVGRDASAVTDVTSSSARARASRRAHDRQQKGPPRSIRPTYWGVFNSGLLGVLVQADLSYTVVLELASSTSSARTVGTFEAEFAAFFEHLRPDISVQVLHLSAGFDSRVYGTGPRRTLLCISVHSAPMRLRARLARRFARLVRPHTLGITSQKHQLVLRELHAAVTRVLPALYRSGVAARPLQASDLRLLVGSLLVPTGPSHVLPVGRQRLVYPGTLRCGDRLVRALSLTMLPPRTDAGLLDALLMRLPSASRVHVAFALDDDHQENSRTAPSACLDVPASGQNPYRVAAAAGPGFVPLDAVPRVRSVVTIFLSVHSQHEHAEELLDRQTHHVVGVLGGQGAGLVVDSDAVNLSQLLAALPGHGRRARRSVLVTPEQAAQLVAAVHGAAEEPHSRGERLTTCVDRETERVASHGDGHADTGASLERVRRTS